MQVLFVTEDVAAADLLRSLVKDVAIVTVARATTAAARGRWPDEATARAAEFDAVVADLIPREFLAAASRLRFVIIPYAGIPKRDRETLREFPHLTLLNCHYNALATAEHAWALLLAAAKRIIPADRALRRGDWSPRYGPADSVLLAGKTLCVIGFGAVGRSVARIAKGFGMRVLAVRRGAIPPSPGPVDDAKGTAGDSTHRSSLPPPEEADLVVGADDLPRVLPEADAVVVCLPATVETDGAVGRVIFAAMKRGVVFVNVGRGSTVDEDAFVEALSSGVIAAAGIDVWWNYPRSEEAMTVTPPSRHDLSGYDNLVLSPHRASHVVGEEDEQLHALARILVDIRDGRPPRPVDRNLWY